MGGFMNSINCLECGNLFSPDTYKRKMCSLECIRLRNIRFNKMHRKSGIPNYKKTERYREYMKAYRIKYKTLAENRVKLKTYADNYRQENKDEIKKYRQTEKYKIIKSSAQSKRRALEVKTQIEDIDFFWINQRDGGKCQICGRKILFNKHKPHPMSRSYDHIIPLSKGGTHTYSNLQLAHLGCNVKKRARIENTVQQFLL